MGRDYAKGGKNPTMRSTNVCKLRQESVFLTQEGVKGRGQEALSVGKGDVWMKVASGQVWQRITVLCPENPFLGIVREQLSAA